MGEAPEVRVEVTESSAFHGLRDTFRPRFERLFLDRLKRSIELHSKALESAGNEELKGRLALEQDALARFEKGEYPLEPRAVLSRDESGEYGAILALLCFGPEQFLQCHSASVALTGSEEEDNDLRDAILRDITLAIKEHNAELGEVVEHLLTGCPVCLWAREIRAVASEKGKFRRDLEASRAEAERLVALNKKVTAELEQTTTALASQQATNEDLRRRAETANADLGKVTAERDALKAKGVTLEREARENPDFKVLKGLADYFHPHMKDPKGFKEVVDRRDWDPLVSGIHQVMEFFLKERKTVRLRETAKEGLDRAKHDLIDADRLSLRDRGYPNFVNREDLVRMLGPIDPLILSNLLSYRANWDRRLGGHRISQEVFDRLMEGVDRWTVDARLASLNRLAKTARIDPKTLRAYWRYGIVPQLARWFASPPSQKRKAPKREAV